MAYSPSLWLMAIGWWNKINQCWKLKLNLTQTWVVCMSLDSRVTRMAYSPSLWLMANWLVKQNQPVSIIETKSDTNLRSLYESWFRNALMSKSVILWWQVKKGINSELEGANTCRVLNILSKRSLYLMRSSHTSAHLQKKSTCFSSWTSPHFFFFLVGVVTRSSARAWQNEGKT